MQKGDKARVIRDCAVKAGSEVEVDECFERPAVTEVIDGVSSTIFTSVIYQCYFNNIRVEIAESDLEVIKAKRWLPNAEDTYFVPSAGESIKCRWCNDSIDRNLRETLGVYRTKEESDAMLAKIQALVTSEIGDC